MKKIKIEIQYFNGCPNSEAALKLVRAITKKSKFEIDLEEILIETQIDAEKYKFRGSPTILINGKDIEGLEENKTPSLSCRYYPNGLPTKREVERILSDI